MVDIAGAAVTGALILVSLLLGVALERQFAIYRRLEILWRRATNAEVKVRLEATYTTDLPWDNLKDEWRSVLREVYGDIAVESDTKTGLDVRVADHFDATLSHDDGTVTVATSKVVTTMRGATRDLGDLFDALDEFSGRASRQTEKSGGDFAGETFHADLELPHGSKYLTYHLPFGTELRSQRFEFAHAVKDWSVRHEDGAVHLEASSLDELERLVKKVLGMFIVL